LEDAEELHRLHEVRGASPFLFLGYTVALNRLDGVYDVDRRPVMLKDPRLSREIQDFQRFLVKDLWSLSAR